jgi:hypothetical protein
MFDIGQLTEVRTACFGILICRNERGVYPYAYALACISLTAAAIVSPTL